MKILKLSLYVIGLMTLLIGCSVDSENGSGDTGKLIVQLTDAPFPHDLVAEANVTVFKIDARHKGGMEDAMAETDSDMELDGAMEMEAEADSDDLSPFVVLMEEEIDVNLLELTNGLMEKLAEAEVPAGAYDLVRVYVRGVNVVLKDGTVFDLKVPSGPQTGIKVFIKPAIMVAGGLTSELLLDVDVSRSFVAKGNAKDLSGITGFNFKPVIKASNMATAGTLSGVVTTTLEDESIVGLEGANVAVYQDGMQITSTFTDADGAYSIMGLDAGSYTVEVVLEGYNTISSDGVIIVEANKTLQDFELEAL